MVKCADCGFFSIRHTATRELQEADEFIRASGKPPETTERGTTFRIFTHWPFCFARQADFHAEAGHDPKNLQAVVHRERDCKKHTPYRQGYSPREHDEMLASEIAERESNRRHKAQIAWMVMSAVIQGGATILAVLLAFWLSCK